MVQIIMTVETSSCETNVGEVRAILDGGNCRIDWGDGNVTVADVAMSSDSVAEIVSGEDIPNLFEASCWSEDGVKGAGACCFVTPLITFVTVNGEAFTLASASSACSFAMLLPLFLSWHTALKGAYLLSVS